MSILERAKRDGAAIFLKTAGVNINTGERDLKGLEKRLEKDEKIYCIVTGKLLQTSNNRYNVAPKLLPDTNSKGVLVVTSNKLIFNDKKIFGNQQTIIQGEDITGVDNSRGMISSRIIVRAIGSAYDLTDVKNEASGVAVSMIQKLIREKRQKNNGGGNQYISNTTESSKMDELKKAKELLDLGIISQEEFDKIKAKTFN